GRLVRLRVGLDVADLVTGDDGVEVVGADRQQGEVDEVPAGRGDQRHRDVGGVQFVEEVAGSGLAGQPRPPEFLHAVLEPADARIDVQLGTAEVVVQDGHRLDHAGADHR